MKLRKLSFSSYADQRKEDKLMEEPQNAYFPFSYFPLRKSYVGKFHPSSTGGKKTPKQMSVKYLELHGS